MAHWLDEIERRESRRKTSGLSSARVQDKKFRIQQNYAKNHEIYDGFLDKMKILVKRVNELPLEYRDVLKMINFTDKDTKLENHLVYFSSSRRVEKMAFKTILKPFKRIHFKHVRVVYFNIAKHLDKVEVEIYEEMLEKKRHDGKVIPENENPELKNSHKPNSDRQKFHEIYYYDMSKLTDELGLQIIDWLTFREEVHHIPIITEGEPRFKE